MSLFETYSSKSWTIPPLCLEFFLKNIFKCFSQDRENPHVMTPDFHQVPFHAQFASQNPDLSPLADLPGVDGFTMDIDPLYKVHI